MGVYERITIFYGTKISIGKEFYKLIIKESGEVSGDEDLGVVMDKLSDILKKKFPEFLFYHFDQENDCMYLAINELYSTWNKLGAYDNTVETIGRPDISRLEEAFKVAQEINDGSPYPVEFSIFFQRSNDG
jgi:hypothetical protein